MERAIKIQHSDEEIKLIGTSCKKWDQKLFNGKFSFVFLKNSFVFTKIGGHTTKMVRMSSKKLLWLLRYINIYTIYINSQTIIWLKQTQAKTLLLSVQLYQ
jgi:hypothetical protein